MSIKNLGKQQVTKKVAFTALQALQARDSRKFKREDGHRGFVEWLFMKQHGLKVIDHKKLIYDYDSGQMVKSKIYTAKKMFASESVIVVHGVVGQALSR